MNSRLCLAVLLAAALALPLSMGRANAQGGAGGGGGTATGADLQISGSASTNSPDPGSVYTYTFLLKNSGPQTAEGTVFTNPVPASTSPNYATLQGSTLPCVLEGSTTGGTNVVCTIGSIAKGGQATIVVGLNAPQTAASITNTATVASSTPDPQPANNSKTIAVTVKAPTGGVCKGGVCDTIPGPTPAPCAVITSASAPVGYYLTGAAIWNTLTVQSCSTRSEVVNLEVIETNVSTGAIEYNLTSPLTLTASQNAGFVYDNDFAPFNTTYSINYTLRDPQSGSVLSTVSTLATTPGPR